MFFEDVSSFYAFVISALVNEANKERVPMYIDYTVGGTITYDAFLPKGLTILEGDNKNLLKPYVVDIRSNLRGYNNKETHNSEFSCTKFVIFENNEELVRTYPHNKNVIFLGPSFVHQLINRNEEAYLNYLLGIHSMSFKKSNDNSLYLYQEEKKPSQGTTYSVKPSIPDYKIEKNDPDKISTSNENDFKAFLNRDYGLSNCAIIVGNGVSIPFGSDDWGSMVRNLVDRLEPFYIEKREHVENALSNSTYALSSFVKRTLVREETENSFVEALRYCIYRKYNGLMHNQKSLIKAIALAKKKYPSLPILTYNYDTFIEKEYHAITGSDLRYYWGGSVKKTTDEMINNIVVHLHGYLSYTKSNCKGIVLSDEDYCNAYLKSGNWTKEVQLEVLKKYNCLFVGSSMSDLFQMSVIQEARNTDKDGKWNCFALMCLKDLDLKEKMQIMKYYKEKGIRLIVVKSFDKLPGRLASLFGVKL